MWQNEIDTGIHCHIQCIQYEKVIVGVSYFAVYNFVGEEVFLFLASKNKRASKWCFCSVICVPVLLRCAGRAQKALVAHSANTPNPGVLIQETCHLRQAYG